MNIIILGAPASGKGTQAELLEKGLGFFHFSSGQLLRKVKEEDPEIAGIMDKGDLIPDDKVLQIIENYLEQNNLFDNIIIDGSPRSLYQYEKFKDFFSRHGKKIDLAIDIKISDGEAIRRLTARREDPKTGEIYNLITNPPGPEVNPGDLIHREDDKEDAVKHRLQVQKVPENLYKAIKKDGILVEIDGERPIKDIYQEIVSKIQDVRQN